MKKKNTLKRFFCVDSDVETIDCFFNLILNKEPRGRENFLKYPFDIRKFTSFNFLYFAFLINLFIHFPEFSRVPNGRRETVFENTIFKSSIVLIFKMVKLFKISWLF